MSVITTVQEILNATLNDLPGAGGFGLLLISPVLLGMLIRYIVDVRSKGRLPSLKELSGPPANPPYRGMLIRSLPILLLAVFTFAPISANFADGGLSRSFAARYLLYFIVTVPNWAYLFWWTDQHRPTWHEYEQLHRIERDLLDGGE